jgi:recombination protein RecA
MKMRETSRAVDKKLLVNNNVGRALKFYSSVRLDVRRSETVKESGEAVSNKVKIKVVKNKVAPPFKEAEFDILYGEGISKEGNILDVAVSMDIIKKSGAWFSYDGERLGQGRDNVRKYMMENPDFAKMIDKEVRERLKDNPNFKDGKNN